MRLFFVAQRVPYPPDRGDKITTFHEVRHLSRSHEVHVFCLADGEADLENVAGLDGLAASVTAVPLRRTPAKARAARALAVGRPFTLGYFDEPRLHRAIVDAQRERPAEAILVYSSGVAQYAERFRSTPRLIQFGDLDSLKWLQYAERARWPASTLYRVEAGRLLRYERRIARTFDHSLVCTGREKADFERLIPQARVSCVANGVDLDYFRRAGAPGEAGAIVFTGVMDYFPNVDGVRWFCDEILPRVQRAVPQARFTICGSRPTGEVLSLGRRAGVTVTGRVPDVRPYLERAQVAVVPLRMARGIQNKLIEAMAMGLPCVATTASWEGIDVAGDGGVAVTDEPQRFAEHVIALLENETLRRAAGARARAAVERYYSWEAQLARLDTLLLETAGAGGGSVAPAG